MRNIKLSKLVNRVLEDTKTAPVKPDVTPSTPRRRTTTPSPYTAPEVKPKAVVKNIINRYLDLIDKGDVKESSYDKIFDPETLDTLRGAVNQRKQGKTLQGLMMKLMPMLSEIQQAEKGYTDLLEDLAVDIVEETYPYLRSPDIIVDAKIGPAELKPDSPDSDTSEEILDDPEEVLDELEDDTKKRRLINALTQGGAAAAKSVHFTQQDVIDSIDPGLAQKYLEFMDGAINVYDLMEEILAGNTSESNLESSAVGSETVYYDFTKSKWVIKARGQIFIWLVHEIVKGLYELIGLFGFLDDELDKNQDIADKTDSLSGEIDDLKYGQTIYNNLRDTINDIGGNVSPLERDHVFQDVYKMPPKEFIRFITGIINKKLTSNQKDDLKSMISTVQSDLKADAADDAMDV